ncbi:hypothetical protein L3X38_044727 [Prunus dulcis]|uniref:Uncharacterized protein n=1 Tax=Prunus dulcis TaxID=3755 RepID=A0AAD4V0N7_PRUDU|nr:hypothetical protein L3X38_044727 [Prunus dulcis]
MIFDTPYVERNAGHDCFKLAGGKLPPQSLCPQSSIILRSINEGGPTPPSSPIPSVDDEDVESQLSLSGSIATPDRREENEFDEIYPSPEAALLHDVPIPPPSPMEQ